MSGREPVRLRIRERPQQQRVDDREHRRVDADADRQRDEGDQREARRLAQHADRIAQVAHEGLEDRHAVHVVDLLADRAGIAEPARASWRARSRGRPAAIRSSTR